MLVRRGHSPVEPTTGNTHEHGTGNGTHPAEEEVVVEDVEEVGPLREDDHAVAGGLKLGEEPVERLDVGVGRWRVGRWDGD